MSDESPKGGPRRKRGKPKGSPKTGGRQKGTRNRNSLSVLSALDEANIPVIELLVLDIQCLEPMQRIPFWFGLLSYCYPKLREVEQLPPPRDLEPAPSEPDPTEDLSTEALKAALSGSPDD